MPNKLDCKNTLKGFLGGSLVNELTANARDTGDKNSIPGSGISPEGENGSPSQYSCGGRGGGAEIPWIEEPEGLQSVGS